MWAYVVGKPTEKIEMARDVTMNEKLATERELLRQLDLPRAGGAGGREPGLDGQSARDGAGGGRQVCRSDIVPRGR